MPANTPAVMQPVQVLALNSPGYHTDINAHKQFRTGAPQIKGSLGTHIKCPPRRPGPSSALHQTQAQGLTPA